MVSGLIIQLLHAALKHNKFDTSEEGQLQMLDPFVPLLSDSLTSRHLKVLSRVRGTLLQQHSYTFVPMGATGIERKDQYSLTVRSRSHDGVF